MPPSRCSCCDGIDVSDTNALPDWYVEKRREVVALCASAVPGAQSTHASPSGRYRVELTRLSLGPNRWAYSRGRVIRDGAAEPLAVVERNFGAFPLSWCEGHPSGHDYLVCGEDYQGQTVVELDTGRRVDRIDPAAKEGWGFCWAAHYPSPQGALLFVDGCIWAAPYEIVLFDFAEPMRLPYRELGRWPVSRVLGWQSDGSFVFEYALEVRREDDVPLAELDEATRDAIELSSDYRALVRERSFRACWRPSAPLEITPLDG